MNDGIIKGDGTSRKVFANLPATYEEFRMQAASGALAMDILFNAAGWQQQPDFLNKKNLLQDTTADRVGLDSGSVPDDALWTLGRLHSGLGNEYIWKKSGTEYVPYVDESGPVNFNQFSSGDTVFYSKIVAYNNDTKKFELVRPDQVVLTSASDASFLVGYYVDQYYGTSDSSAFKCMSVDSGGSTINLTGLGILVKEVTGVLGYVNSPDHDAYPPSEPDEFTYSLIGQLGSFARTIAGSYTGTGESTKSLTFPVLPQFLIIYKSNITIGHGAAYTIWAPYLESVNPNVPGQSFIKTAFSTAGTTLTLTGNAGGLGEDEDATLAMNTKDAKYYYFAVLG